VGVSVRPPQATLFLDVSNSRPSLRAKMAKELEGSPLALFSNHSFRAAGNGSSIPRAGVNPARVYV
jgi:hypothetical protein